MEVGALYIFDENYWKRRCVEKLGWQNCQIAEHGLTWKQLFFEASAPSLPNPLPPSHRGHLLIGPFWRLHFFT